MKSKRIVALVTVMLLIMSLLVPLCYADDSSRDDGIDKSITTISATFTRTGNTSARANVSVSASITVNSITSTVYLQKWNSSEEKYKTVSGSAHTKTVASNILQQTVNYTISSTGKYRIKVKVNDGTETKTKYVKLS